MIFAPGKTIEVTVAGVELLVGLSHVVVNMSTLTTPTAAFIDDSRGVGTILNDDGP